MKKRWIIKEAGDKNKIESLSKELNIAPALSNLLLQRGISNFEEAKKFFRPDLADLHDPFLMKDMDLAVSRIIDAMQKSEKILVFGDYDVDGTTAVALVYSFIKSIHPQVDYYVPDRYAEGYGISNKGIDFAADTNCSLIIALDCGIKSIDKVNYARQKRIDFIICDHHRPGHELPQAVAVLDPKRNDCNYPYDELSGCGIGFKLVQAIAIKKQIEFSELKKYLDLTAISIAADIVPITGENRILTYFGLEELNKCPRQGIKSILQLNNIKKKLTVSDLVFIIAPRINAAGRVDNARKAIELFISEDEEKATISSNNIHQHNLARREFDTAITQQALEMIASDKNFEKRKTTVLFNSGWHKGVLGIVASRLTDVYYRPTIVLTESDGKATGSVRSVKNFDVYNAVEACGDLLEQYGGHKYAAGLTLKLENLDTFKKKFEEVVASTIHENMLIPEIEIDMNLSLSEITPKFQRVLKQFAPFGPGNMSPVFVTENLVQKGFSRIVGNNHLKLSLNQSEIVFDAIAFNQAEQAEQVESHKAFSTCFTIEENEWNGEVRLQLNIKDFRF